jgi:hypothetical protein
VDHPTVGRVTKARTLEAQAGRRALTKARARFEPRLYKLVPAPNADPDVLQQLAATVRCERALGVGNQVWVQQECWELVARVAAPDDAPQRAAFLCATSPLPRARIVAATRESWLYEPDLLDLAAAVRRVHADETPATRTIQAAIRAALHGGAEVAANLEGDALRVIAQAIRGLEISQSLSPALQELGRDLNQHFDDLETRWRSSGAHGRDRPLGLAGTASRSSTRRCKRVT